MGKKPLSNDTSDTNKSIKSPPALFFPYITDFVIAALSFIVVLLVTWGLHYLGNTLDTTWFRFSWRILEMAFISFGTLLCVLFFLKASVEFSEKLIRWPHKPSKQVGGKPFRLHQRDIIRRFGEPLHKRNLGLFIFSVFIIIAFLYVGISFAGLVQSNCDDMSILACALICETGPDFMKQIDSDYLKKILVSYTKYMEHKQLSVLLKVFPNYNPKEVFADVNEILLNAKGTQKEAAHDIWRAGEEVMLFRLKTPKLLPRGMALHEYRKATESLLPLAKEALLDSNEASKQFNNTPTMENAVHSCERNRLTMLLLFPLWPSYDRLEVASLFTRFQAVVETCRDKKIEIANRIKEEDDPRKEFLKEIIAESEQRRLDILMYIEKGNIQEAIQCIWDAIDESYTRRTALLKLCEKIRSSGNYSKEISF